MPITQFFKATRHIFLYLVGPRKKFSTDSYASLVLTFDQFCVILIFQPRHQENGKFYFLFIFFKWDSLCGLMCDCVEKKYFIL